MPTIWTAIYLGNSATWLDPFEGNQNMENALSFQGTTFGSVADPLWDHRVAVTAIDNGADAGILNTNNSIANDQVSYDLGTGTQTRTFDGTAEYSATITYIDGTTATVTAVIFQDSAGNIFLAPETALNADTTAYEAMAIRSITLNTAIDYSNVLGLATTRYQTSFLCFAAGTAIATATGQRPVELLRPGDLVVTRDHGLQPLRWSTARRVRAWGAGAPVRIRAGALGPGQPARDLWLSQQHRLLLRSRIARRMTGHEEVLIAAKRLCGFEGIELAPQPGSVSYCHLAFDRHEIVLAEGLAAESLFLGDEALRMLEPDQIAELAQIFPGLGATRPPPPPARPLLSGPRSKRFCARHFKKGRALSEAL